MELSLDCWRGIGMVEGATTLSHGLLTKDESSYPDLPFNIQV